jgi:hypothetical protein
VRRGREERERGEERGERRGEGREERRGERGEGRDDPPVPVFPTNMTWCLLATSESRK